MLTVIVPPGEMFDEENEIFIKTKGGTLQLEHSLISISKWEAKYKKPFLDTEKSLEETLDYIRCMTVNPNVDSSVYLALTDENILDISRYISDPMSATTFSEIPGQSKLGGRERKITSELIYYYMVAYQIPVEFEKWHINRLMTLIKICNIENQEPKKMSRSELAARNRSLNAARRAKYHTKG